MYIYNYIYIFVYIYCFISCTCSYIYSILYYLYIYLIWITYSLKSTDRIYLGPGHPSVETECSYKDLCPESPFCAVDLFMFGGRAPVVDGPGKFLFFGRCRILKMFFFRRRLAKRGQGFQGVVFLWLESGWRIIMGLGLWWRCKQTIEQQHDNVRQSQLFGSCSGVTEVGSSKLIWTGRTRTE